MVLGGAEADANLVGNLPVGGPSTQELNHLALSTRQARPFTSFATCTLLHETEYGSDVVSSGGRFNSELGADVGCGVPPGDQDGDPLLIFSQGR